MSISQSQLLNVKVAIYGQICGYALFMFKKTL